jgi:peptidoglycan/LPS O-acetylase OafA/YrhL
MHDQSENAAHIHMDAMRTLLAVAVAFGHIWALLIRDYQPTANIAVNFLYFAAGFGHSSVILFFVLSGYWITRSVVARTRTGWSWRAYLSDRLVRLLLVLVPALALTGVFDGIAILLLDSPTHRGATGTYVVARDIRSDLTLEVLVGNLFFLQEVLVRPFGSNGPLWSIAFEFWYYLWFPALWLLVSGRRVSLALVTLAIGLINPELPMGFVSWLCGALLVFADRYLSERSSRQLPGGSRATGAAALLFLATLLWARSGDYRLEDPALAAMFALFLLAMLQHPPRIPGPVNALARYGASASFSLYATHFPLMALCTALIITTDRIAPSVGAILLALAILAFSIGFGWVFASGTEKHTMIARRHIRRLMGIGGRR